MPLCDFFCLFVCSLFLFFVLCFFSIKEKVIVWWSFQSTCWSLPGRVLFVPPNLGKNEDADLVITFFFFSHLGTFPPWCWKVCLFDQLRWKVAHLWPEEKQEKMSDPREFRYGGFGVNFGSDLAEIRLFCASWDQLRAECREHRNQPVKERRIWALYWPRWGTDLISNRLFWKASLLVLRCVPIHRLLKNSRDKGLFCCFLVAFCHPVILCFYVLLFVTVSVPSCSVIHWLVLRPW